MAIERSRLDRAFNPRTVAVIGDSVARRLMWLRAMSDFQGKLYSVQINPDESQQIAALGVPSYRSILDIPDEIDYAVCSVPRGASAGIIADCARKNVGGVGMFTAGFAETGEPEGIRLEAEIVEIAKQGGLPVIGPNCMGVYNPSLGLRQTRDQPIGPGGRVGLISQSGTHAVTFSFASAIAGPVVSKAVSVGNAVVLDIADYLEYMADDPETEIIAMYIEGLRDGRRFFEVLRRAAARKPVVIWKGGIGEAGARAIASHTASLATSETIWSAVMRQCGAISVNDMEELVDTTRAFLHLKPCTGRRTGLMAMTGGQSVMIADAFARAGLDAPLLTDESYGEISSFFNIIGGSYRNPLDMGGTLGFGGGGPMALTRLLDIFDRDANIDAIVMEASFWFMARYVTAPNVDNLIDGFLRLLHRHKEGSPKPFVIVAEGSRGEEPTGEVRGKMEAMGLLTYPSFERAARSLRRFIEYHRFRAGLD